MSVRWTIDISGSEVVDSKAQELASQELFIRVISAHLGILDISKYFVPLLLLVLALFIHLLLQPSS